MVGRFGAVMMTPARLAELFDSLEQGPRDDAGWYFAEDLREALEELKSTSVRRDELLAVIARISQTTPLDSEVRQALEQRAALIAEIGTLRSMLAEACMIACRRARAEFPLSDSDRIVELLGIARRAHTLTGSKSDGR